MIPKKYCHNLEENLRMGWTHNAAYALRDGDIQEARKIQTLEAGTSSEIKAYYKADMREFELIDRARKHSEFKQQLKDREKRSQQELASFINNLVSQAIADYRTGRSAQKTPVAIHKDSRRHSPQHDAIF